ncbi:MAG: MBL fold metallo-hydrolase [Bacteriovorax sp.]|jgi:glyoxylase-like metal-dependent hydrolase (beta-lactamase superfamily II)
MIFYQLIEAETSTYTYLLADETTREAILIDTVLECVDRDLKLLSEMGLTLKYVLDTHVHADHITASGELRKRTGAKICLSFRANVPCIDVALHDGDELHFGSYHLEALETPGHTDSCMSFKIADMIFTGDVLLVRGTGRTDFQQGSPEKMYQSIHEKIFKLAGATKIYPGHDYKGFTYSSVELEKKFNPRVGGNITLAEFKQIMSDLKLAYPKKIDIAVPANMNCGLTTN